MYRGILAFLSLLPTQNAEKIFFTVSRQKLTRLTRALPIFGRKKQVNVKRCAKRPQGIKFISQKCRNALFCGSESPGDSIRSFFRTHKNRGYSSVGRAMRPQCIDHGFKSHHRHQNALKSGDFSAFFVMDSCACHVPEGCGCVAGVFTQHPSASFYADFV